jgi:hypothetical protein
MSPSDFHMYDRVTAPAYRVEAPHASDAVGSALRDAFARELGLPDDMAAMLTRLNGRAGQRY